MIWAHIDGHGVITMAGSGRQLPPGALYLPAHIAIEDVGRWYWDGDLWAWAERPELPAPVVTGTTLTIAAPDGSIAMVADRETGAVFGSVPAADGVIEIEFADPGSYRIEVSVPAPWLPLDEYLFEREG